MTQCGSVRFACSVGKERIDRLTQPKASEQRSQRSSTRSPVTSDRTRPHSAHSAIAQQRRRSKTISAPARRCTSPRRRDPHRPSSSAPPANSSEAHTRRLPGIPSPPRFSGRELKASRGCQVSRWFAGRGSRRGWVGCRARKGRRGSDGRRRVRIRHRAVARWRVVWRRGGGG
jgi:hypothetical protein